MLDRDGRQAQKPFPSRAGILRKNSSNASREPADPPIPTIWKAFFGLFSMDTPAFSGDAGDALSPSRSMDFAPGLFCNYIIPKCDSWQCWPGSSCLISHACNFRHNPYQNHEPCPNSTDGHLIALWMVTSSLNAKDVFFGIRI